MHAGLWTSAGKGNFRESLDSIRDLWTGAMDEIASAGMEWGAPGSQPQWPPLRELNRSMSPFREEVIRRGDRDQVLQLMHFDSWLMETGWRRRCGEMFTVGLDGHRRNCEIARRVGSSEFGETLRDQLWLQVNAIVFNATPEEMYPYIAQMVRHQERLLSDAMQADSVADYERLHKGFDAMLGDIRLRWEVGTFPRTQAAELYDGLEQDYRIALMGLGGRAVILADAGKRIRTSTSCEGITAVQGNWRWTLREHSPAIAMSSWGAPNGSSGRGRAPTISKPDCMCSRISIH